jgi:hypothetical protein
MKTSQKLRALLLASFLTGGATQAADPQQPQQPMPDVQALISLLNKLVADAGLELDGPVEATPAPEAPAPADPVTPAAPAAPIQRPAAASAPALGGLKMSSLSTGGLAAANSPTTGNSAPAARLSNEDWRALFTSRTTTK